MLRKVGRAALYRRWFTAPLVLAGLALASCTGTGSDADGALPDAERSSSEASTSTSSTTSSPVTTRVDGGGGVMSTTVLEVVTGPETQEVVDRYLGYWEARFDANAGVPNPDDPRLAEFATGRQLDQVRTETRANLDQGLALRAAADPANLQRVTVASLNGDRAVVQECAVSDDVVFRRDTGQIVNDSVVTYNVRGELERVQGVWRVAAVTLVQKWQGVAGCALAS
jgi:hypothetical protein